MKRFFSFLLAGMVSSAAASAAVIDVNDTSDNLISGNALCTLREAVMNANADADTTAGDCATGTGDDTINLPDGNYVFALPGVEDSNAGGDLDLLGNVMILGSGAESTILEGADLDRVLQVHGAITVELRDLAITGGLTARFGFAGGPTGSGMPGGGIANEGDLTLQRCRVELNATADGDDATSHKEEAGDGGVGGGIYNAGLLSLEGPGCSVAYNTAGSGGFDSDATLPRGGGDGGSGGGVYNAGTLLVDRCEVSGNIAGAGGGSLLSAGGDGGSGGGIFSEGAASVSLTRGTVAENSAGQGGGGAGDGAGDGGAGGGLAGAGFRLTNSTVSGNLAWSPNGSGGGAAVSGIWTVEHSTIANNTGDVGGGLWLESGSLSLKHSLLAGNFASSGEDCGGAAFDSFGYNLIQDTSGCLLSDLANPGTNVLDQDALLLPLDDNGGASRTHSFDELGAAKEAGELAGCTDIAGAPVTTDQRDGLRPAGSVCDIGAFELFGLFPLFADGFESGNTVAWSTTVG